MTKQASHVRMRDCSELLQTTRVHPATSLEWADHAIRTDNTSKNTCSLVDDA